MASGAAFRTARPVLGRGTQGLDPGPRSQQPAAKGEPSGGPGQSAESCGARRLGRSSGQRARRFLEPHPRRKAGGAPRGAGRPGFRAVCRAGGGPRAGLGGVCRPALAVGTREGVLGAGVQAVAALERAAGRLPSCSLPGEVMNVLVDPFHRPGKERPRMGGTGSGVLVPRVWEAKSQVTGSVTTVEAGTGLCDPGRTGGWRGNTEPAQSVPVDSPTPLC